jgi:hypothetical protein
MSNVSIYELMAGRKRALNEALSKRAVYLTSDGLMSTLSGTIRPLPADLEERCNSYIFSRLGGLRRLALDVAYFAHYGEHRQRRTTMTDAIERE